MASPRRLPLLALLPLLAGACHAHGSRSEALLFSLEDPRGDDHGDGELRYPLSAELEPGSLDLLSFRAYAEGDGTRFEATFARPIAVPQRGRTMDATGVTQADRARHGFYTFNLDVYVDEDGVEGSGRTDTLPDRNLQLASGSAWEKVILLTPRPYEARNMLREMWREQARQEHQRTQGPLGEAAARALDAQVERNLEERIYFPTRIRVAGPTVSFFVPEAFLGARAQPTWGYAVAVTGSSLERKVDLPALFGRSELAAQGLILLGIQPGVSRERFGGGRIGDPLQSPVVDLMVPEGVRQEEVLGPKPPPWPAVVPASPAGAAPRGVEAGSPPVESPSPDAGVPPALPDAPDAGGAGG